MNLRHELQVKPGEKASLHKIDPDYTAGYEEKDHAEEILRHNNERLAEIQRRFYAANRYALLIVLQAMDAGGKDGTIQHVMSGVNPQGCSVTSFKAPSDEELDHDYLWRIHKAVPARGDFGIFNRSHYEDVLIARVHQLVPEKVWEKRYDQINAFEQILAQNNVIIVKFFLRISKEEQKARFQARLDDPTKNWKICPADFEERKYWDDYMEAYEDALTRCSTPHAPWYVIPANKKWFRNLAVSQIILDTLSELTLEYPKPSDDIKNLVLK